ncbi:MAG TPA: PKD domain-containing protein, partial [Ilumatobacteraceae bacterium]|nr:PKD domain-containing protein [Ilumatobacteraceae bacterium]
MGEVQDSIALPGGVAGTADLAYDSTRDRLITAPDGGSILAVPAAVGRVADGAVGATTSVTGEDAGTAPAGVDANLAGEILILGTDGALRVTRAASPTTASVNRTVALAAGESLDGLAVAADGHLFSIGTNSGTLYEFDAQGAVLAARDLAGLGIEAPTDLAVAPSGDTSDASTDMSVYIADAGTARGTGGAIVELALAEAPLAPQALAAAATASVSLVRTTNTGSGSTWNPDSPDPSGLAYIPASETEVPTARRDRLVSGDGEVDENTGAGFHNVNVWFAPRNGAAQTATFNTNAAPTNPTNNEPVGVAYDPVRNELYICNDGNGARVWVYNAATMAQVRVFTVNNAPYNNADSEGLAFGNNTLYMVDALDNDLVKVQPGPNGVVGTGGDDVVSNYDLEQYGQREPEGLDVHPETGNIWVVSNRVSQANGPDPMIEVTPTGGLVSSVSIAAANPNSAGGLAIAPPSNGSAGHSIYVADRGVDNNDVPSENDGKIYEFSLDGGGGPTQPVAGFSSSQTPGTLTVNFTDDSTGSPTSWSWDFGNGGSTIDSAAQNPSFTYAAPGPYTVTLTATNGEGSDGETKTITVSDPSAAPNLLLNPSFELDTNGNSIPDDWGIVTAFTRSNVTPAQDGSFVGRHLANNAKIFQQVNVTAGTSYDFSGMVNLPATSDAFSFALNVQWRAGNTNLGAPVVIHTFNDDTNGAWQSRTATLTAPAGATSARIQMDGNSMNATGTAYVDAFSFKVAGPPPPPVLDTTITGGPSGSTTATNATFTFAGTAPAVSFECRLDTPTWTACTSPQSYPGPLALGPHTFDVRAIDASSNPDP